MGIGSEPVPGRRLEDAFFLQQDQKLIAKLREMEKMKATVSALREVSGIHDEKVLVKLAELGVHPQTISALSLVPLVMTSWADGAVDEQERKAVMAAAGDCGMEPGCIEHDLLERWMERKPALELLEAWEHYIRALCGKLGPDHARRLKGDLLGQARSVAKASGGFLGLGNKVSAQEEAMLERLERAFGG
jgi:hypothetical protein